MKGVTVLQGSGPPTALWWKISSFRKRYRQVLGFFFFIKFRFHLY